MAAVEGWWGAGAVTILRNVFFGAGVVAAILLVVSAIADVGSLFGLDLDVLFLATGVIVGTLAFALAVEALRTGGQLRVGVIAIVFVTLSAALFGAGFRQGQYRGGAERVEVLDAASR